MTDREKINIKICNCVIKNGYCLLGNYEDCKECPMTEICKKEGADMVPTAKKYLAEHPDDNEWKPLEVDILPPDILTGDYEFQYYRENSKTWETSIAETEREKAKNIVNITGDDPWKYRYRKRQPEAPSREEIMTKWWEMWDGSWCKVYAYFPDDKTYGFLLHDEEQTNTAQYRSFYKKDWFIGRESAGIPPEDDNDI